MSDYEGAGTHGEPAPVATPMKREDSMALSQLSQENHGRYNDTTLSREGLSDRETSYSYGGYSPAATPTHSYSTARSDGMSMGRDGSTPRKKGKTMSLKVQMLDDSVLTVDVVQNATGVDVFLECCRCLNLYEMDYFGLEYYTKGDHLVWLEPEKPVLKQVAAPKKTLFHFSVKFYLSDPGQLHEEFTKYLFALQVKKDLANGRLPCSENTAALMASYILQAEVGDYSPMEHDDGRYITAFRFVPNQSRPMELKIQEYHKNHIGQTMADADFNLLDVARRLEMYGVRLHPAKDYENVQLYLAVSHQGTLVFQNNTKINTFSWAKIRKLSFKRKRFLIKLHPEGYGYPRSTVEFLMETRNDCKQFWKTCVEHHAFFRLTQIKYNRSRRRLLSRGSTFRYSGRTQKQVVEQARVGGNSRSLVTLNASRMSTRSLGAPRTTTPLTIDMTETIVSDHHSAPNLAFPEDPTYAKPDLPKSNVSESPTSPPSSTPITPVHENSRIAIHKGQSNSSIMYEYTVNDDNSQQQTEAEVDQSQASRLASSSGSFNARMEPEPMMSSGETRLDALSDAEPRRNGDINMGGNQSMVSSSSSSLSVVDEHGEEEVKEDEEEMQIVRPIADILRPLLIGGKFTSEEDSDSNSSLVSSNLEDVKSEEGGKGEDGEMENPDIDLGSVSEMLSELDTVSPSEVENQIHSEATLGLLLSEMSTPGTFTEVEGGFYSLPEVLSDTEPNSDIFKSLGSPDAVSDIDHDDNDDLNLSPLQIHDSLFVSELGDMLTKEGLHRRGSSSLSSSTSSSSSSSSSSEDFDQRERTDTEIKVEHPITEVRHPNDLTSPSVDDAYTFSSYDSQSLDSFSHTNSEAAQSGIGRNLKLEGSLHSDYRVFRQERKLFFESDENLGQSLSEANANLQILEDDLDETSHTLVQLEESIAETRETLQAEGVDAFTETSSGTDPDEEVKGVISKGFTEIEVGTKHVSFSTEKDQTSRIPSILESLRDTGETASPTPLDLKIDYLRDYDELFQRDNDLVDDESGNSSAPLQSPPHHYVSPGILPESSLPKLPELSKEMVAKLEAQTEASPIRTVVQDEIEGGGDDILGDLPTIGGNGFQGPNGNWHQRGSGQSVYVSRLKVQIPRPGELLIPPGGAGSTVKSSSPGSDDSLRRHFGTVRNPDDLVSCSELSFGNLDSESLRVHCDDGGAAAFLNARHLGDHENLSESDESEVGSDEGTTTSSNDSCVYQYKVSEARYTKTHSKSSLGESGSSSSEGGDQVLAPDTGSAAAAHFNIFSGSSGIMTGNGRDLFADLESNDFSLAASTCNSEDFD